MQQQAWEGSPMALMLQQKDSHPDADSLSAFILARSRT
jgi:hypothetical protein